MRWSKKFFVVIGLLLVLVIAGWVEHRTILKAIFGGPAPVETHSVSPASNRSSVVYAFDGTTQAGGVPAPWQSRVIVGKLSVSVVDDPDLNGHRALQIDCQKSHFILYNGSQTFDPKDFPILQWSWKALKLPAGGDVRTHAAGYFSSANHNDKALQVLVGFEGDRVISYVWDTTAPVGTVVDEWSPVATIKTDVVESGSEGVGSWQQMKVNLLADYQKLYGAPPGRVVGVSVQTNSNHTSSSAAGLFGPIRATTDESVGPANGR